MLKNHTFSRDPLTPGGPMTRERQGWGGVSPLGFQSEIVVLPLSYMSAAECSWFLPLPVFHLRWADTASLQITHVV